MTNHERTIQSNLENNQSFERFIKLSEASQIPIEYTRAADVIRDQFVRILIPGNATLLLRGWQEMAYRLIEHEFTTHAEAHYAITYGGTIATIKLWLTFQTTVDSSQEILKGVTNTMAAHADEPVPQPLGEMFTAAKSELEDFEQVASWIRADGVSSITETERLEERARERDPFYRRLFWDRSGEMLYSSTNSKGLQKVREYLEDYFSSPQNKQG